MARYYRDATTPEGSARCADGPVLQLGQLVYDGKHCRMSNTTTRSNFVTRLPRGAVSTTLCEHDDIYTRHRTGR